MSRGLASTNITASQAAHVIPVLFVEIVFDSQTLRIHDHVGPITWGGNTFLGGGAFVEMSPIEESDDRTPYRVWMRLNALNQAIVDEALGTEVYQRPATVYLGFLNEHGALVADPDEWDSFWCDNFEFHFGEDVSTITLNAESDLARDQIANGLMFSDGDQQKLFSGDTGFQFLAQMVDARVYWGPGGREATAGAVPMPTGGSTAGASGGYSNYWDGFPGRFA